MVTKVDILNPVAEDTRIAYGAHCTWWGNIQDVGIRRIKALGTIDASLPCCPFCKNMLFEHANEEEFLSGARTHEDDGHPGYVEFILWLKGKKCFKTIQAAMAFYQEEKLSGTPTNPE